MHVYVYIATQHTYVKYEYIYMCLYIYICVYIYIPSSKISSKCMMHVYTYIVSHAMHIYIYGLTYIMHLHERSDISLLDKEKERERDTYTYTHT